MKGQIWYSQFPEHQTFIEPPNHLHPETFGVICKGRVEDPCPGARKYLNSGYQCPFGGESLNVDSGIFQLTFPGIGKANADPDQDFV